MAQNNTLKLDIAAQHSIESAIHGMTRAASVIALCSGLIAQHCGDMDCDEGYKLTGVAMEGIHAALYLAQLEICGRAETIGKALGCDAYKIARGAFQQFSEGEGA